MSDKITRSRGPNFSKEEQLLLFSIMQPYIKIIECKNVGSVKQIEKQRAWSKVANIYNASTKGVKRTTANLISCYRNTKNKSKKQNSESKFPLEDPSLEVFLNAPEDVKDSFDCERRLNKQPTQYNINAKRDKSSSKKKRKVNESFYALAQEKMELFKMQRTILEMEMNHKSKLYELELQFKAELHQKELHLLQLKINKESQ